jgi:hypothetical protein
MTEFMSCRSTGLATLRMARPRRSRIEEDEHCGFLRLAIGTIAATSSMSAGFQTSGNSVFHPTTQIIVRPLGSRSHTT